MKDKILNILEDINIDYGFVDKYGIRHRNIKKNYYLENYQLQTIEDTIKYNIGTCYEYVELIRSKIPNIESYIILYNDPNKIARHTIAILSDNNKYYWLEKNYNNKLIEYNSLEEIFNILINSYPRIYKIDNFNKELINIYEYSKPTPGMSYQDFENHVKKGKQIII